VVPVALPEWHRLRRLLSEQVQPALQCRGDCFTSSGLCRELDEAVTRADEELRQLSSAVAIRTSPIASESARVPDYSVRESPRGGIWLIELREGSIRPMRCPDAVYRKLAVLMPSSQRRGLKFKELHTALEGDERFKTAIFSESHLRVCLRFWMSGGLITRRKGKYFATRDSFADDASQAWARLEKRASAPSRTSA